MTENQSPRLFYRQKLLLGLLDVLGGRMGNLDFQKYLFLYCQDYWEQSPIYEFVPYKLGAFSFTSYADRRKLIDFDFLQDNDQIWELTPKGRRGVTGERVAEDQLNAFVRRYRDLHGDALIAETYRRYPYYAIRSEIADRVLNGNTEAIRLIEESRPRLKADGLSTIGYEGLTLESYLNRLLKHGVTLLCDVRRNAISRKYGFSKSTLSKGCEGVGIHYEHLPELGIASERRQDLKTQADYKALFEEYNRNILPRQGKSIERIRIWIQQGNHVALTCYERLPQMCHRRYIAESIEKELNAEFKTTHL
jgi:hypothetical protein